MANDKDFNTLDELFRHTFDNLSDQPAPNGWDTPSERVWQQVATKIQKPRSGWKTKGYWLMASFVVVVGLGLYWANTSNQDLSAAIQPAANTPTSFPVEPSVAAEEVRTIQNANSVEKPTQIREKISISRKKQPKSVTPILSAPIVAVDTDPKPLEKTELVSKPVTVEKPTRPVLDESAPLPGTKVNPPNSTEKLREELRLSWKRVLSPLPMRQRFNSPILPLSKSIRLKN